jgi:hypothetical protein
MITIKPEQLTETLAAEYLRYVQDISEVAEEVADEIGQEALNMVRSIGTYEDDPEAAEKAERKAYRKSFYTKKEKSASGLTVSVKVANRIWSLTHLLEKGHAKRGGGRTRAFPHWEPTERKYVKVYEQRLIARIKRKGGG